MTVDRRNVLFAGAGVGFGAIVPAAMLPVSGAARAQQLPYGDVAAAVTPGVAAGDGGAATAGSFMAMRGGEAAPTLRTLRTSGFSDTGRGAANYVYDPAIRPGAGDPHWTFTTADGRGFRLDEPWPDAAMFGAIGNGVADDTAALRSWIGYAIARVQQQGREPHTMAALRLPPGRFRVTGTLLPAGMSKTNGFHLQGAGEQISTILLEGQGLTLFDDTNGFLIGLMSDLCFLSSDDSNIFMNSVSTPPRGANQGWSFERVAWGGRWGRGFVLTGSNNNSEWRFNGGGVSGKMGQFVYIPGTAAASDQFLNFWFDQFKFWPTDRGGNCMIDFGRGGHVKITNSDFSGLQSGVVFRLAGSGHARGVCYFTCESSRFELKSPAVSVMQCGWGQGLVSFRDNDFSSQLSAYPPETIAFDFRDSNAAGATISFEGNDLIGRIAFRNGPGDAAFKKITSFRNNSFRSFVDLFDAFLFDTGGAEAGRRALLLENNRGGFEGIAGAKPAEGLRTYISDCTFGAASAAYASGMIQRFASLSGGGDHKVILPPGVLVVGVRLSPRGGSVALMNGAGRTLAQSGGAFQGPGLRTGMDVPSRTMRLVANGGAIPSGDYLVEYIG